MSDIGDIPVPDKWATAYFAIVPRITGVLSVMSSSIIIYVVYRSAARTSTIYHRIMVGMSICDILFSTAISLTSLPMPKQLPFEDELRSSSSSLFDNWDPGPRYGNTYTCNAQGFFFTFAGIAMFLFNVALCVYYGCSIGLQMREDKIRKYIQPILLGAPILFGLIMAIPLVIFEMMNPPIAPWHVPWCVGFAYPYGCSDDEEAENTCLRGSMALKAGFVIYYQLMLRVSIFIVVLSLALVIWRVVYTNRKLRLAKRDKDEIKEEGLQTKKRKRRSTSLYLYSDEDNLTLEQHTLFSANLETKSIRATVNTRAILIQCLAYIVAWFLGVAWDFMPMGITRLKVGLLFLPLQGFFNMIIFLSHKVYNYRMLHQEESIYDVLKTMFTGHIQEPCFISRISFVEDGGEIEDSVNFPRSNIDLDQAERKGQQLTPEKDNASSNLSPNEDDRKELQDGRHEDALNRIEGNDSVQDVDDKFFSVPSIKSDASLSFRTKGSEQLWSLRRPGQLGRKTFRRRVSFDSADGEGHDDDDNYNCQEGSNIKEGSRDKDIADIADLSGFSSAMSVPSKGGCSS